MIRFNGRIPDHALWNSITIIISTGYRKKKQTLFYEEMNMGKISIYRLFTDEIWTTE